MVVGSTSNHQRLLSFRKVMSLLAVEYSAVTITSYNVCRAFDRTILDIAIVARMAWYRAAIPVGRRLPMSRTKAAQQVQIFLGESCFAIVRRIVISVE